jgi:molecular chaperone Hsp33
MTDDGAFRVITVEATDTVRAILRAQKVPANMARLFGELVIGAILIRETLSPDLRIQSILQGDDGRSRMVTDAQADGTTRGLLQLPPSITSVALGTKSCLQVARTLHNGALHQGVVSINETLGISGALMSYLQTSEQIVSMIAVGCRFEGDEVVGAAGYLVQLLPDLGEGPLMVMTERLKDFEKLEPLLVEGKAAPAALLSEILYGMPYTTVGEVPLSFGCPCSNERMLISLSTLPRTDIQELIDAGEPLEIACDYCGKEYAIAPEQLRGLIASN